MKKKFLLPILALIITALIFLTMRIVAQFFSDYQEYTYKTYEDAQNAKMIDRGWIPDFVPDTAKDIRLGYDIDTNDVLLKFNANSTDFIESSGCLPTKDQASHALDAKWWSDAYYDAPATRFFQCGRETWLASSGDTIWYWSGLKEIAIKDLTRNPKSYLHLDGKQVTLIGYVDFYNVFDTRAQDDRDSFALVPDFEKAGENTVFVRFDQQEDAFALLDEIHNETSHCTETDIAVKLAVSGTLRTFEMPMNFVTDIGYEIQVHDLGNFTFLANMDDSLPSSIAEFNNRIKLELPNAKYPLKLAPKGWVQLREGFAVTPLAEDSVTSLHVVLGEIHSGDLNNDDLPDVAALLIVDAGGSGTFVYLTAALGGDDGILPVDTVLLGDRIIVDELYIHDGEIHATSWTRSDDEPMSAEPTLQIRRCFRLQDEYLVEVTAR